MRDYGNVKTAFWTDPKVAALARDAKYALLYLLTSPHTNALGCFRVPAQYIAADMGEPVKWVRETIAVLIEAGIIEWHEETGWVWIRNYIRHNPPANGNVLKKCWREYEQIPSVIPFLKGVWNSLETVSRRFGNEPEIPEPYPEPYPEPWVEAHASARPPPSDGAKGSNGKGEEPEPPAPKPKSARGSRLPEQWEPPPEGWQMAVETLGTEDAARSQLDRFRDHWAAQPGQRGVKLDWPATWRNWVRKAPEFGPGPRGSPASPADKAKEREMIERYLGNGDH